MRFCTGSLLLASLLLFLQTVRGTPNLDGLKTSNLKRNINSTLAARDLGSTNQSFLAMVNALEVMQSKFWDGTTWPLGIAWTEAVFNTIEWAALSSIARYRGSGVASLVDKYYSQLLNFFDGENTTQVLSEKYDDMQWVALEWLEAIKFLGVYEKNSSYIAKFAHRSRIFWDVASQGYNTTLCGGGMVWTYSLLPYKNAITNELFIASSIGMYLYSPGDSIGNPPVSAHDPKYLNAAIEEYNVRNVSLCPTS